MYMYIKNKICLKMRSLSYNIFTIAEESQFFNNNNISKIQQVVVFLDWGIKCILKVD